jgi:hypothetical protein
MSDEGARRRAVRVEARRRLYQQQAAARAAFVWPQPTRLALEAPFTCLPCREPNKHHLCFDAWLCACACHELDNDERGWLLPQVTEAIEQLEKAGAVGPYRPGGCNGREGDWWAAAAVLAAATVGPDPVRISHALLHQPTRIHKAAERMRAAGLWTDDTLHARWIDATSDEHVVELTLHVLVAAGAVRARRKGTEFVYWVEPRSGAAGDVR